MYWGAAVKKFVNHTHIFQTLLLLFSFLFYFFIFYLFLKEEEAKLLIKQTSPYITHGRWTIGGRCQSAERPPLFPYNISTWKYISRPFFQNVWRDGLTPTPKNSATFIKILFLPEREKNISFQITVHIGENYKFTDSSMSSKCGYLSITE